MGQTPEPPETPRVEMRGIAKRFGEVSALKGASLTAWPGEIHALLGENGAGKTTLMNVLSGLYRADAGEIRIDGARAVITSPRDALRYGIGMVHQHVELVPHLSALENILLGREGSRVWLRLERQRRGVEDLGRRVGLSVDLAAPVRQLDTGARQKVEILKALYREVRILILDEPTTLLAPQEVDGLFATVQTLAEQGLSVIFITHKIREVLRSCDRVTVMRAGSVIETLDQRSATEDRLVGLVMGERPAEPAAGPRDVPAAPGPPLLAVRGLRVVLPTGIPAVEDCSLTVAAGEILGVAGVSGNGQRELVEALIGILPREAGTVELGGQDISRAPIRERISRGLMYIPEDRLADGLLPARTLAENVALGLHPYLLKNRWLVPPGLMRDLARRIIADYGIAAESEDVPAAHLSGGNIQKLLVARAMTLGGLTGAKVLIAMNPTRGLDVRSTAAVHDRLQGFRRQGGGVLLVSTDLDELMELGDRIAVMYRGRVAGILGRRDFDALRIGRLMAGVPEGTGA
jgi:simple sugar transport system ATP-binding protein